MILFLFLFGLALGAESPSKDDEVKLQRDNPELKLVRGTCPVFWFSYGNRCYKYVATRLNWADAELYCVSENANLVSIHSVDEHEFIKALIKNFDHADGFTWIGLSDIHKEGSWMWSDGSRVDFVYWSSAQPDNSGRNEHCVHNNVGYEKKWNDYACAEIYPSVCATQMTCR